ncbi:hypothetical protein HDU96_002483 [Phlyctochytrium bullatum]|nr:hypothetical protein HDU96_002483 [Phlyctochytrium bullatum]
MNTPVSPSSAQCRTIQVALVAAQYSSVQACVNACRARGSSTYPWASIGGRNGVLSCLCVTPAEYATAGVSSQCIPCPEGNGFQCGDPANPNVQALYSAYNSPAQTFPIEPPPSGDEDVTVSPTAIPSLTIPRPSPSPPAQPSPQPSPQPPAQPSPSPSPAGSTQVQPQQPSTPSSSSQASNPVQGDSTTAVAPQPASETTEPPLPQTTIITLATVINGTTSNLLITTTFVPISPTIVTVSGSTITVTRPATITAAGAIPGAPVTQGSFATNGVNNGAGAPGPFTATPTPADTATPPSSSSPPPAVLAGGIGGALLAIAIAVLVAVYAHRRRARPAKPPTGSPTPVLLAVHDDAATPPPAEPDPSPVLRSVGKPILRAVPATASPEKPHAAAVAAALAKHREAFGVAEEKNPNLRPAAPVAVTPFVADAKQMEEGKNPNLVPAAPVVVSPFVGAGGAGAKKEDPEGAPLRSATVVAPPRSASVRRGVEEGVGREATVSTAAGEALPLYSA